MRLNFYPAKLSELFEMSLFLGFVGFDSVPPNEGQCAAVTTVLKGMTKEAKILLDHRASPNHIIKSEQRNSLLHVATWTWYGH